jgi:hypothetical protein
MRAAHVYAACKTAFTSFRSSLEAFIKKNSDLGIKIESETEYSVRLTYLDRPLEIALSIINAEPVRGVLKVSMFDQSGEREKKVELTRIYIDDLGNAWGRFDERRCVGNITMQGDGPALLLEWLKLFLQSQEFSIPA